MVARLRSADGLDVVIGSRVALMGADIRRSAFRHYTGRLFATAGSLVLGVPVYDTQCGAKAFRVTETRRRALATPFVSRWAFDVELLGRLLGPGGAGADRCAAVAALARAGGIEADGLGRPARRCRPRAHPAGAPPSTRTRR